MARVSALPELGEEGGLLCCSSLPLFSLDHEICHAIPPLQVVRMGQTKLSVAEKTRALTLLEQGVSVIRIAADLKVTSMAIYNLGKAAAASVPPVFYSRSATVMAGSDNTCLFRQDPEVFVVRAKCLIYKGLSLKAVNIVLLGT